ncbi:MAG: hypothetical protein R2744_09995 [Bacteroidales bacterium]
MRSIIDLYNLSITSGIEPLEELIGEDIDRYYNELYGNRECDENLQAPYLFRLLYPGAIFRVANNDKKYTSLLMMVPHRG